MPHRCDSVKKIISVDFGQVEVGTTAVKSVKILNESCKEQIYEARRDPATNPLDYVFNLRNYTWTLCPEEACACEISYRPFVPSVENADYFTVTDSTGVCVELMARGYSVGPDVSASTNKVVMICPAKKGQTRKRVKLINKSKTNAVFMFDVCNTTAPFYLDATHGSLGHNSEKYVTITFAPDEEGVYTYYLNCLIHYQSPIVITLYGVCGVLGSRNASALDKFIYLATVKSGFEGYMYDCDNVLQQDVPLMSLSKSYFHFCPLYADVENIICATPQVVCLTNQTETNALVKWTKDPTEVFNVTPQTAHVQPKQCVLFEISFNPRKQNCLFTREFIGSVFYGDKRQHLNDVVFPSFISVRVTGHSFPVTSDGWIPQYEIPQSIVMPPCIPSQSAYRTFLIKARGHLPLMFRFLPPSTSHFIVKPMLGVIYQGYQVIVVRMLPKPDGEQGYMERWGVQFNGSSKYESYVDFRGYAEYASIGFNDNNSVLFAPNLVGCQQTEQLVMRNVTRHAIMYRFIDIPPTLHVQSLSGEISSNSIVSHTWTIHSNEVGYYDFEVKCAIAVVQPGNSVDTEICVPLRVTGRIDTAYLVAIPNELNFGEQAYNQTAEQSFHVFNFSSVNVHFKLLCVHQGWPLGCIESDVNLRPITETVCPGRNEKITVSLTPRTPGYYQLTIAYLVRQNSQTDSLAPEHCPVQICQVNCMCVLPTFQIRDIHCYGSSKIASKAFLWHTMKINKINTVLKSLLPEEEESVYMHRYSMALNKQPINIKLILTNPTGIPGEWAFRRVQLCSCQSVSKSRGLSFRYYEYDCEHRKVCSIYPKSGILKPKKDIMITVELLFTLPGKTDVKWEFNIGNNRRIFISMTIDALSGDERELSLLYGTHLKFEQVYLGEKEPAYQVCWIHNYMNYSLPYSVDSTALDKINEAYCNELFACVTSNGIVQAATSKAIIFKFQPRQLGQFEVKVPLTLGDYRTDLLLEGKACISFGFDSIGETLPAQPLRKSKQIPVYFSVNSLDAFPISMHNHAVKILLIHNHSTQDIVTYTWKRYEVPGILVVKFYPEQSIIQPRSTQSVCVTINSAGCPCRINVNIPCEFVNVTKRRKYQKSAFKYDTLCKELEGQFVIEENSMTIPKSWLNILEKPEPFTKVLSVRCLIYDSENEELHSTVMSKLKSPAEIEANITEVPSKPRSMHQIALPMFVLEGILWDVLNSKVFQHTIHETVRSPSNLYYSQFKMDLCKRKRLENRARRALPRKLIEELFGRMLFIIIHEEFSMETIHFIKQNDVRDINYLKLVSRPNEASVHNEGYAAASRDKGTRSDSTFTVSFVE